MEHNRLPWIRGFIDLGVEDGKIYREKRHELVEPLTSRPVGFLADVEQMMARGATTFGDVAHAIKSAEVSGALSVPAASIYRSIIHMNFNRLWGLNSPRELESLRLFRRVRQQIALSGTVKAIGIDESAGHSV